MAVKELTIEQSKELDDLLERARVALKVIETYNQERVDKICRAVCWAVSNKQTFQKLVDMSIKEGGLGDPVSRMNKRFKIRGILRDILRQKSVGIIEEIPEKGLVKYAKPAGIIGSIAPTTNPDLTPAGQSLFSLKARNAIIFSPHPRTKGTTKETCEIMRRALKEQGAPEDLIQCVENPSTLMTEALQSRVDLIICTAGTGRVKAAYSSGKPAYGSGAGNATMIYDETADVVEACHNTMLSKTSDYGSGCSADGNLIIHESIFDACVKQLEIEGGYLASEEQKEMLHKVIWDETGKRLAETVAIAAPRLTEAAGFSIPEDRKFIYVIGGEVSKKNKFNQEKLTTLVSLFKYAGEFENAIEMMHAVYNTGGKGHSVGIYSHNKDHIHRLALVAPVSRIMVRQPQSKANAGSTTNGMPMTSSLGCGTWGGNIVSENICLKHYMNTTWVSVPIPEDNPSPEELFGEFYDPEMDK
jgi:sulfoacetaldehyde dehydrogenase